MTPGEDRNRNWKLGYILDGLRTAASAEPDVPSVPQRSLAATRRDHETVEPPALLSLVGLRAPDEEEIFRWKAPGVIPELFAEAFAP